ncbi:unnamed protein product [Meganyctiphanes norvegica]|uniref:ATP synthase F0 subunit 8 n=1 Tax=Meganyctiphanes norvegica TaxID=48144 RepID=A0AAV2RST7_MEGNR
MFLVLLTPFDPFLIPYPPIPLFFGIFTFLMLSPTNRSQHSENPIENKQFRAYFVKLSKTKFYATKWVLDKKKYFSQKHSPWEKNHILTKKLDFGNFFFTYNCYISGTLMKNFKILPLGFC